MLTASSRKTESAAAQGFEAGAIVLHIATGRVAFVAEVFGLHLRLEGSPQWYWPSEFRVLGWRRVDAEFQSGKS